MMDIISDYNFEEFTSVKSKFTPSVSLVKPGGFNISSGFVHRYPIANKVGVKLYYDKGRKAVGIRFLTNSEPGMFKLQVRSRDRGGGGYFGARSFLTSYGIDLSKFKKKYFPEPVQHPSLGEIFVLELEQEPE